MAMVSAVQEAQKDNLRNFGDYMMTVLEVSCYLLQGVQVSLQLCHLIFDMLYLYAVKSITWRIHSSSMDTHDNSDSWDLFVLHLSMFFSIHCNNDERSLIHGLSFVHGLVYNIMMDHTKK